MLDRESKTRRTKCYDVSEAVDECLSIKLVPSIVVISPGQSQWRNREIW